MRPDLALGGAAVAAVFCFFTSSATASTLGMSDGPARAVTTGITVYVDDDAPDDPGPNDQTISDPLEDGSAEHPFDSVREAIDYLLNPCSLIILPGTYHDDLYTPASGCIIQGSGRSITFIRSVSGVLMEGLLDSTDPFFPPVISIADVTLEGGSFSVLGVEAPGEAGLMEVTIRDAALSGVDSTFHLGGFGGDNDRMHVTLDSIDLAGSGIRVEAQGGVIDLTMESSSISGGDISLQSAGVVTNTEITSLFAPSTLIQLQRSSGGRQNVLLRDSTIATLDTRSVDYSAASTIENVHFTGNGILTDHGEGSMTVTIADSTFDNGGVSAVCRPDIDSGSTTEIRIARSVFHGDGVTMSVNMWAGQFYGVFARLDVDSTLFLRKGVSATIEHAPWDGSIGGTFDLSLTNNVFDTPAAGVSLNYQLADPGLGAARGELHAAIVNNTFHACRTGLDVHTSPHIPGLDDLSTLIQNNVIAGGDTGIQVIGTDGHVLTVSGNDVHGNTVADYSGDLPDQTGLNGNISADPGFVNAASGDFSLQSGSLCIDAGQTGPAVPATDHDGNPRPQDGDGDGIASSDIGAFEFVLTDEDGDGFPAGIDCNDDDPLVYPGAPDLPGNAVDENCDGKLACSPLAYWKGHGEFIKCVRQECGALVMDGRLDDATCDALVYSAVHSEVGRSKRFSPGPPEEP